MSEWWKGYPWRMIQTNLREIDMEDIDAASYVKALKEFGATVALLNMGGILASYETKVEDHVKSSFLHGSSLMEIIDACHKDGIKVLARMDFSKAREEVYLRHPDWAYRDIHGDIINYNGDVHMCICGNFSQVKSFEIMEEVLKTFPVDGVFFNMGGFKTVDYSYVYHGICHCANCQKKFKEYAGLELPEKEDMKDPVFRTYKAFQEKMVGETNRRLHALMKSINPDILIGGRDFIRTETKTEYNREKAPWNYGSSSVARGGSTLEESPLITNANVDFVGFLYRHNSVGPERMELRFEQDIANYCGLDYYIMGRLDNHLDRASYPVVKKAFSYMKEHEALYQGMKTYKNVLLVRNGGNDQLNDEAKGWIRTLTESHILFGEAGPNVIKETTDLTPFKAVIVPDLNKVPAVLASQLDSYVEKGGTLVLSGVTEYYDGLYKQYETIPYASMYGTRIRQIAQDQISGMLRVREEDRKTFPSLEGTEVLYYGDNYVSCDYPEEAERHLSFIPPHPFGPPERCYFTKETEEPGYVTYRYGKGKVIYIPWAAGKRFHLDGYLSTYRFLKDILEVEAGLESTEDKPFSPMVEVTYGYSTIDGHRMIHLINGTGCFGNSVYEPIPVFSLEVKVPSLKKPAVLKDVEDGHLYAFTYDGHYIHVKVEKVEKLKAILIEY